MAVHIPAKTITQFLRFLCVGSASALLNTVIIVALTELIKINYLISYAICFLMVNYAAFAFNRAWSFGKTGRRKGPQAARYYCIAALATLLAMAASRLLVAFSVPYWLAVFFSAGALAPFNFLAHRWFSFGVRDAR